MGLHRPDRSPSQRYRFEQFLPYLKEQGFEVDYFYLINAKDDIKFYGSGNYLAKIGILIRSIFKLFFKSFSAGRYDLIFVQREAFMLGTVFFERLFARKAKIVFDFDDAIWLQVVSDGNKGLGFLKDASKTAKLIGLSDMVFAGNSYLADYGKQFNTNTKLVPTVVNSEHYKRLSQAPQKDKICIGWSGSFSTIPYFEHALPALRQIKSKYGDRVYFKVIGDENYSNKELNIKGVKWTSQSEVAELSEIDIGIMPLPNDEWTKGKCALKGLLYMSLEQAAVLSDVGVNSEIIQNGVNGFLATSTEDWVEKLSLLIENPSLRQEMGQKGRQTVVQHYSVLSEQEKVVRYFNELIG